VTTTEVAPTPAIAPRAATAGTIPHVPALDGLRGLAVVAVLAYHGHHLTGGYLGVDLFFVLSGYLITSLMLAEIGSQGRLRLGTFWVRRARRLFPALITVTIAVAIGSRWWADPVTWRTLRDDGFATLGYVANWHTIWSGGTYGANLGGRSPFEHTWSLAIEEQFYLLWPLLVVGFLSRGKAARKVLVVALGVAAASYGAMVAMSFAGADRNTLYLGTHTRIGAVALGCALAAWRVARRTRTSAVPPAMVAMWGWIALAVLAIPWFRLPLDDTLLYRGGFVLCGICAMVLIWSSVEPSVGGPDRLFALRPLREIGLRSYGLYLWHWPIFVWLEAHPPFELSGWALFALELVISGIVAAVSYVVIEQPIRRGGWQARQVYSLSAGGALIAVGALVIATIGAPPPLTVQAQRDASGDVGTLIGTGDQVAIFGDSVAEIMTSQGVIPLAEELGISVRDGGVWGCSLVAPDGEARDGLKEVLDLNRNRTCALNFGEAVLAMDPQPKLVVMFFGGIPFDTKIDGEWRHPCDDEYRDTYRSRAEDAIRALGSTGASVAVVLPAPARTRASIEGDAITDIIDRQACVLEPLQDAISATGVGTVDLIRHQCGDDATCIDEGDPDDPRVDGLHYEHEAAERLARWLIPEAARVAHRVT
jgi:peptidoglycan/LPS O-acetylase OafA/YrhL